MGNCKAVRESFERAAQQLFTSQAVKERAHEAPTIVAKSTRLLRKSRGIPTQRLEAKSEAISIRLPCSQRVSATWAWIFTKKIPTILSALAPPLPSPLAPYQRFLHVASAPSPPPTACVGRTAAGTWSILRTPRKAQGFCAFRAITSEASHVVCSQSTLRSHRHIRWTPNSIVPMMSIAFYHSYYVSK